MFRHVEGTLYAILAILFAILIDMHDVGYRLDTHGLSLFVRWQLGWE